MVGVAVSIIGRIGTESVKGLGPGAYLATVLPSAVLVTALYFLFTGAMYPWTHPVANRSRGFSSAVARLEGLGPTGIAALAVAIVLASVLLRPLNIAAVQLLEGYWGVRGGIGLVSGLATERHVRR